MDALAKKHAPEQVGAIFIYTHEAHPAENYPHHTSFKQKLRHASDMQDRLGLQRPILIDNLEGDCHRAFGSMPNMSWIIDRMGRPVYKADWTDAEDIAGAVVQLLNLAERRRVEHKPMVPYVSNRLMYRFQDRDGFLKGLERNGPRAVTEYLAYKERQKRAGGSGMAPIRGAASRSQKP